MHEQRFGPDQAEGVSGAHMNLVSSYVEPAKGPPPRSALRFYIDGEWVEVPSAEPEPALESVVTAVLPEPAPELAAKTEVTTMPLAEPEEVNGSDDDPRLDLPIYRWFGTGDADDATAAPGWPRSLLSPGDAD